MASLGRKPGAAPITSADIPDNSITAAKIVADTIAAGDLAPNSVGASELADDAVDTAAIADSVTLVTPNIGTVTAGNLSNTAIVYPSGHILQVKHAYESSSPTTVTATGDFSAVGNSYFTFEWGTEITTTVANSLIFLVAQIGNTYSTAGNPSLTTSIARYKAGSEEALCGGVATDGTAGGAIGYTTGGPPYGISRSSSPDQQKALHMSIMDKPLDAAGTVLKYYIVAFCVSTSAAFGYQTHNTLCAMEIMP